MAHTHHRERLSHSQDPGNEVFRGDTQRAGTMLAFMVAVMASVLAVAESLPTPASATNPTINATAVKITADSGQVDSSPLEVDDHLGQPIFGVLRARGAYIAGDQFPVLASSDIYHGQITTSPSQPDQTVCVRAGQLWIGGTQGAIWRCDGSAWHILLGG
jgi:hypothetical protein